MRKIFLILLLSVIVSMSSFATDGNKKTIKLDNTKIENVTVTIPSTIFFYEDNTDNNMMSIIAKDRIILNMIKYQITDKTLIIDLNNRNLDDNFNDLQPADIQIRLPQNVQLAISKNMQILNRSNIKKNKKSANYGK